MNIGCELEGRDDDLFKRHQIRSSFYEEQVYDEEVQLIINDSKHTDNMFSGLDDGRLLEVLKKHEHHFLEKRDSFLKSKQRLVQQALVYIQHIELNILLHLAQVEEQFYCKHKSFFDEVNSITNNHTSSQADIQERQKRSEDVNKLIDTMEAQLNTFSLKLQHLQRILETECLLSKVKVPSHWLLSKLNALPHNSPNSLEYVTAQSQHGQQFSELREILGRAERIKNPSFYDYSEKDQLQHFIRRLVGEFQSKVDQFFGNRANFKPKPAQVKLHSQEILSFDLSPDNETLATCSRDRSIKLYNLSSQKVSTMTKDLLAQQITLSFLYLGAACQKNVYIWELNNAEQPPLIVSLHSNFVAQIKLDSHVLISCSYDKTLVIQDLHLGKIVKTYLFSSVIQGFAVTKAVGALACIDEEGRLHKWKLKKHFVNWRAHSHGGSCVDISADGLVIASGCYFERVIKVWNSETHEVIKQIGSSLKIESIRFSSNQKFLQSFNGIFRIHDLLNLELEWQQSERCLLGQNNEILVGVEGGRVLIWQNLE